MSSNLDTRSLLDEHKGGFFDLGHPLLNRIAESFVKAAGIGAVQAVAREAYFIAVEGSAFESSGGVTEVSVDGKRQRIPNLRGESNRKSLEALVKCTGKESLQWGLAAGVYSGLTYGLKEARGAHDWKNSAIAGAVTGVALALTSDDTSHEQIVQSAHWSRHLHCCQSPCRDILTSWYCSEAPNFVLQPCYLYQLPKQLLIVSSFFCLRVLKKYVFSTSLGINGACLDS